MSNNHEKVIRELATIKNEIKNINKLFDQLPCTLHTDFLTKLRVEDEKIKGNFSKLKFNIYAAVISFILASGGIVFSIARYFK